MARPTRWQSVESGTVAAIAGGIDQIYPPQHDRLYDELCRRGTLVTESPLGRVRPGARLPEAQPGVISGLLAGHLHRRRSGRALRQPIITARFALEQGREVMTVPGSPLDPRAKGANRLLKQGAALIESSPRTCSTRWQGVSPPTF